MCVHPQEHTRKICIYFSSSTITPIRDLGVRRHAPRIQVKLQTPSQEYESAHCRSKFEPGDDPETPVLDIVSVICHLRVKLAGYVSGYL